MKSSRSFFCLQSDQCSECIRSDAAAPGMWAWRLCMCEGAVGGKPGSHRHQRLQWGDAHALRGQAGYFYHNPGETEEKLLLPFNLIKFLFFNWCRSLNCKVTPFSLLPLHPTCYPSSHNHFLIQIMCSRLCPGVNELNSNGETPLHVACRLGRVDAVKALLEGGAKCDVNGGTGYAIHSAMKYSEKGWGRLKMKIMTSNTFCCL